MHSDVINKRLMIFYFIISVHDQDEHFIFIKSKFFMKAVYPELPYSLIKYTDYYVPLALASILLQLQ